METSNQVIGCDLNRNNMGKRGVATVSIEPEPPDYGNTTQTGVQSVDEVWRLRFADAALRGVD
jgi:hypothetical protein